MILMSVWASIGSQGTLETVGRIITIIIGTSAILLGFAKYVALPWLEKNLVKPVEEVNTQVTVNNHVSDPDTLLDTVHNIENRVDKLEELDEAVHNIAITLAQIGADTGVIKRMWDHHLEWSSDENKRVWKAIDRIDAREGNQHDGK